MLSLENISLQWILKKLLYCDASDNSKTVNGTWKTNSLFLTNFFDPKRSFFFVGINSIVGLKLDSLENAKSYRIKSNLFLHVKE